MTVSHEPSLCIGVALTVSDVAGIANVYRQVLDFEQDGERLRLGDFNLLLRPSGFDGRPMPAASRANDHWFRHLAIVVRDMTDAYRRLVEHGVEMISEGPQTLPLWNKEAAGIKALYFRDPDRHALELIHFPPDKGNALWHKPGDTLFQGVDHTAIVVSQTEPSLRFYRDQFGFRVIGASHNHGAEQEALSGVPAASVQVTALAGSGTCGIELLEYDRPRDGQPQPADTCMDDLWWATTLIPASDPRSWGVGTYQRDPDGHGVKWI